jgi:hypothetical protein
LTKAHFDSGEAQIPLQDIYSALGHAIRYDIVQYLGSFHRPVQYTELVEWLQIKPGSFYFHMKKLKGLVEQDSKKRFKLTDLGTLALEVIQSGQSLQLKHQSTDIEEQVSPSLQRFSIPFFGGFIRTKAFDRNFSFLVIGITICQILLLYFSKLGFIPFFLDGGLYFGIIECILEYIASTLVIWISLELLMRFYSPIKGFSYELLIGIPLTLLPLFIYPILVIVVDQGFSLPIITDIITNTQISIVIIFFLQIMTAIFLTQLLQVIKSVNFERALIPVFILLYGFSILSFFISGFL